MKMEFGKFKQPKVKKQQIQKEIKQEKVNLIRKKPKLPFYQRINGASIVFGAAAAIIVLLIFNTVWSLTLFALALYWDSINWEPVKD